MAAAGGGARRRGCRRSPQVPAGTADPTLMVHPPVGTSAPSRFVHVGRQPIYDGSGRVVAFELLFRGSPDSESSGRGDAAATVQVIINTFGEFGLTDIAGGLPCFVNLTREFLTGRLPLPFGPEQAVPEVLETGMIAHAGPPGPARPAPPANRLRPAAFPAGSS